MIRQFSPFNPGDEGLEVELYQSLMKVAETGVWSEQNEREYEIYMARNDWEIFYKIMNSADGERVLPNWIYA